jgi:hypothetical protein
MLSRHWYEIEEVEIMLVNSILEGNRKEAIFWLLELVDSDELEKAWGVLVRTWILYINFMYDFWILAAIRCAENGMRRSLLVDLCLALTGCKVRDCSTFAVILLQNRIIDDEIVDNSLEFIRECITQGNARSAWAGIKTLDKDYNCWSILKLNKLQQWNKIIGDRVALCGAVIWECGKRIEDDIKWKVWISVNREEINKWIGVLDEHLGRKSRRIFAVQEEILYGLGGRGVLHRAETTRWLLQGDPMNWWRRGDSWWKRQMEYYGIGGERGATDERLEKWWSDHFIGNDDIPDEWGLDEINKSHGGGILGGEVLGGKIWRIWLDNISPRLAIGPWNLRKVCENENEHTMKIIWWGRES